MSREGNLSHSLLGVDTDAWLAIAGVAYASATFFLAWATHDSSKKAAATAREVADKQIEASGAGIALQIGAANDGLSRQLALNSEHVSSQIEAAANAQERQIVAMRDAALIQARASSVSNNRQAWINALRDEVTGFLTDAELSIVVRDEMRLSDEREHEQLRIRRALTTHIFKVRLLINPTEGESTTLVEMLQDVEINDLTDSRREAIVAHTQKILKTEWERVKSGE